jgi:hypothetical protein
MIYERTKSERGTWGCSLVREKKKIESGGLKARSATSETNRLLEARRQQLNHLSLVFLLECFFVVIYL